jgi:hypothetical protein
MSEHDQRWWAMARKARAQLETLVISNPDVQMVSIGIDPEQHSAEPGLIVTIRHGAAVPADVPNNIDGLPVRVIYANYQLEQGAQHDIREETEIETERPPANRSRPDGVGGTLG